VRSSPFRFVAGLVPFGTDFGNGAADRQFFQIDNERARCLCAKQAVSATRHAVLARDGAEEHVHQRVLPWIRKTLATEHPNLFAPAPDSYRAVAANVQEDLVVLHRRQDGTDAAIMVDVCFPSDWRPERIVGTGFRFIHGPVPGFADSDAQAAAMVAAMIDRGPHVRFVWTLTADDHLDHHPEQGRHTAWRDATQGFLRVERQVTVPFTEVNASLFLIRTYLYGFADLGRAQRVTIARALQTMPEAAARYKNFLASKSTILRLLDAD
jgi:heme-dependent oxidative N-demethylase alpha subunit-like protein